MKLSDMQLFRGLEEDDISSLLSCLNSVKRNYKKGEVILSEGSIIENIGIVLSGMAMISCNDIWGNTGILGSVAPGSVFAEVELLGLHDVVFEYDITSNRAIPTTL